MACSSDHHVSPYPPIDAALLLRSPSDLEGQLARALRETSAQGLTETRRIPGKLPGGTSFVALGFEGRSPTGARIHATRVVTPNGIVLALGPPSFPLADPAEPTELLPALLAEGGFPSGVDLTGDGAPDVALRAADGTLAVFRVESLGATRYPCRMALAPTRAMEVNGDGRADLASFVPVPDRDPLAPELVDVAIGGPGGFDGEGEAAAAFHRRLAERPPPAEGAPPAMVLRHALETAFHAIRAGAAPREALVAADDVAARLAPLPAALAPSWVRWRGFLESRVTRGTGAKAPRKGNDANDANDASEVSPRKEIPR